MPTQRHQAHTLIKALGTAYRAVDSLADQDLEGARPAWIRALIEGKREDDLARAVDALTILERTLRQDSASEPVIAASTVDECRKTVGAIRESLDPSTFEQPAHVKPAAVDHRRTLVDLSTTILARIAGTDPADLGDRLAVADLLAADDPDPLQDLADAGYTDVAGAA